MLARLRVVRQSCEPERRLDAQVVRLVDDRELTAGDAALLVCQLGGPATERASIS